MSNEYNSFERALMHLRGSDCIRKQVSRHLKEFRLLRKRGDKKRCNICGDYFKESETVLVKYRDVSRRRYRICLDCKEKRQDG